MKYVGVDGCHGGWLAIEYADEAFRDAEFQVNIDAVWDAHDDAALILIDVPIGLREESNTPRPCDATARARLGSPRSSSVFPTPVRDVLGADGYTEAREIQETRTNGSLGAQTWGISNKIEAVDDFLHATASARETVREAHPEICYWALNDEHATTYSKTGAPVAGFWERVEILEKVDDAILDDIREAGKGLECAATNDDLVDAFVLAVTASPLTAKPRTLPEETPDGDDGGLQGRPMEMVYARPTSI